MSRKPILGVYFIIGAMIFIFERFFFLISQGSTAQGILRKWQVPHPMETIKMEHSREIWSKTTAWAEMLNENTMICLLTSAVRMVRDSRFGSHALSCRH